MAANHKEQNKIADMIVGCFDIACDKCLRKDVVQCFDVVEAADYFYEEGWRVKRTRVYCKRCNKKK